MRASNPFSKLPKYAWPVVVVALIATLVTVSVYSVQKAKQGAASTLAVMEQDQGWADKRLGLVNELSAIIGYGGVIHDFKNYVLRADPQDAVHFEDRIHAALRVLDDYEALPIDSTEKNAIDAIRMTLLDYQSMLGVANGLIAQGKTPGEIDPIVEVDDTDAVMALSVLRSAIATDIQKSHQRADRLRGTYASFLDNVAIEVVIVLFGLAIVALAMYMAFILKRSDERRRAVEAQEQRLNAIMSTVAEGIVMADRKGTIVDINSAAVDLFGYDTPEDLLGQSINVLMPQSEAQGHDRYIENYTPSGQSRFMGVGRDLRGQRKDGSSFDLEVSLSTVTLKKDIFFTAVIRDITARVEAERALREAKAGMDRAQSVARFGSWEWDLVTGDMKCTDVAYELFGYEPGTVQPTIDMFMKALHPDDRDGIQQALEKCQEDNSGYHFEARIIWPDQSIHWVALYGEIDCDAEGHPHRMISVVQDITRAKRAEEDLRAARDVADKANQAKSEFLSNMSHELRTPLNAILGFAQLLRFNRSDPLSDAQVQSVEQIEKGGKHLLTLINEILDLSKIEAGHVSMSIEDIGVADVLAESLATAYSIAEQYGINVDNPELTSDIVVRADFMRLKQVLLNFLSNAIKYNRPNGHVDLLIEEGEAGRIRIGVRDTGEGIPHEKLDDLFVPFNRLGAENTDIEGSGVGLALTKQLVERMDGAITVESTLGIGSVFWVELPGYVRERVEAQDTDTTDQGAVLDGGQSQTSVGSPDKKYEILYVEDNPANVALMKNIFKMYGNVHLLNAHDAEIGVSMAIAHKPDLILMDIHLPGMSGMDALKRLEMNAVTAAIPVIALSADATPSAVERGKQAGFVDYLTKPIDVGELIGLISKNLSHEPRPGM